MSVLLRLLVFLRSRFAIALLTWLVQAVAARIGRDRQQPPDPNTRP